jgi:hypothetical protein
MTHVRAAAWRPGPAGNLASREPVCTGPLAYVGLATRQLWGR